jgi:hypothetical protein
MKKIFGLITKMIGFVITKIKCLLIFFFFEIVNLNYKKIIFVKSFVRFLNEKDYKKFAFSIIFF